jgi:hypothetical protein
MNSRKKIPNVEGGYTSSNTRGVPPARSTLTSSMLSAPHIIAAMIEVSFPAVHHTEFNPSRPQIHMLIDQLRKPGLFSQFQHRHQYRPATRFRSSNTAESTVNVCDDCIESAFQNAGQTRFHQPLLSQFRRIFTFYAPITSPVPSTDSGLHGLEEPR